ncbi:MAG: recombinase family protein [Candidatus Pacebacteria bacterium]|nr:recombinase family protein [Candidatus Paceibacterota bacterium]
MRCAIYCRVSTEEQKEGGTIDSQIRELEDFAQANGHIITARYIDDGWSGSILNRPELDHLRDKAGKGLFEAVLVNDVDRLSRELTHLGITKKDLEKKNVKLIFKKLPNNGDPISNFMVNMLGSFAEFERELIADRTRRGRRYKVEVRKLIQGNTPPYGYTYVKKDKEKGTEGHYEINEQEAEIVKMMFGWVVKEGVSQREVVRRLTSLKIPPRKSSTRWGRSSVHKILTNETYTGVTYYYKHQAVETDSHKQTRYYKQRKTGLRLRPKDEWIPIPLPDSLNIIDKQTFLAAQSQFDRNITYSPRNAKYSYLLKGLVKCQCGSPFTGTPSHGRLFYRCGNRHKTFPLPRECKASIISAPKLESIVWNSVANAVQNPKIISDQVKILEEKRKIKPLNIEKAIKDTQKELESLKIEEERLFTAYRKGIIQLEQFENEVSKTQEERTQLNKKLGELAQKQNANLSLKGVAKSVEEYCRVIRKRIDKFTFEQRQTFLRFLLEGILIEGNKARIFGLIPVYASDQKDDFSPQISGVSETNCDIMPTTPFYKDPREQEKPCWQKPLFQ